MKSYRFARAGKPGDGRYRVVRAVGGAEVGGVYRCGDHWHADGFPDVFRSREYAGAWLLWTEAS